MTFEEKIIELGNFFKNNGIEYTGENQVFEGEKKFVFTFDYKISNDDIVICEEIKLIIAESFQGILIIALEKIPKKVIRRISMSYDILCIVNESNKSSSFSKAYFEKEDNVIHISKLIKADGYETENDKIFFYLYHLLCQKKIIQLMVLELLDSTEELTIEAANDFYKYCIERGIKITNTNNRESEDPICFLFDVEKQIFDSQDDFECYIEFYKEHYSVTLHTNIKMAQSFFEKNIVEINKLVNDKNGCGNLENYSIQNGLPIVFITIELYGKIINDAHEVLKNASFLSMRKDSFMELCYKLV